MPSATDRLEFGPPPSVGSLRAFGLALLAHLLLVGALTWGVNWKRSDQAISFEAELWSSVPQEAAPRLVEVSPPPPPPVARAPETRTEPPVPSVDIALEQEKKRKLLKQQKDAEIQKQDKLKTELQAKNAAKAKEQQAKEDLAKRQAAEDAKKAEAKKRDTKEQAQQKMAQADADKRRQENINRIAGLAGATGGPDAKGSALQSSGPSASYGGKIRARIKPNVVFTDDIVGNPIAEVEVRTTPDGTILSQRLVKSSGNKAWDDAVIKAIIRTASLPRDTDGRVPTPIILEFRPKD